jgi:phospholipid transport system substrate-binding protein
MKNMIDPMVKLPGRRLMLGMAAAVAVWPREGHAQAAGQAVEARKPVADLYSGLQATMRMGTNAAFQQQFNQLAPVIDRDFDLAAILQTSVGLRWASLDETSQRTLYGVFRTFTVASYTANFGKDGGEKFEILPDIRASGNDLIVASRLVPSGGDPVRIDYVVRSGTMGWRIIDVLLNGSISRVAVQRSDFRKILANGDTDALIASLRRKIADLSDGALNS